MNIARSAAVVVLFASRARHADVVRVCQALL